MIILIIFQIKWIGGGLGRPLASLFPITGPNTNMESTRVSKRASIIVNIRARPFNFQ